MGLNRAAQTRAEHLNRSCMQIFFNHYFLFKPSATTSCRLLGAAALLMPPLIDANVEQHGAKKARPPEYACLSICPYTHFVGCHFPFSAQALRRLATNGKTSDSAVARQIQMCIKTLNSRERTQLTMITCKQISKYTPIRKKNSSHNWIS